MKFTKENKSKRMKKMKISIASKMLQQLIMRMWCFSFKFNGSISLIHLCQMQFKWNQRAKLHFTFFSKKMKLTRHLFTLLMTRTQPSVDGSHETRSIRLNRKQWQGTGLAANQVMSKLSKTMQLMAKCWRFIGIIRRKIFNVVCISNVWFACENQILPFINPDFRWDREFDTWNTHTRMAFRYIRRCSPHLFPTNAHYIIANRIW